MGGNTGGPGRRNVLIAGLAGAGMTLVPGGLASAASRGSANRAPGRRTLNLDTDWAFWRDDVQGAQELSFDDSAWAGVSIPHTMRLERKEPVVYDVFAGIGWYRRYFRPDPGDRDRRVVIRFDGVQTNCQVYLNGEKLAEHHGGYLGFSVDVTDKLHRDSDNLLAVRVSNLDDPQTPPGKPRNQLGFLTYGGIYRNVTVETTGRIHITDPLEADRVAGGGVFVTYPHADTGRAVVQARTNVVNSSDASAVIRLQTTIRDPRGEIVARESRTATIASGAPHDFEQSLEVIRPDLWHPDRPHLYELVSEVFHRDQVLDSLTTRIGIRRIEYRADGLYINGERLFLRGANIHQNYAYVGDAAPASMKWREALRLKLGGFNAVRAAHYPHDPAFLDAADELGLLVVACAPGWQFWSDDETFVNRTYADAVQMIRRDRNRPSMILWETALNETQYPEWWSKKVTALAHAEIPNDQMFTAADYGLWGEQYYDVNYKVVNSDGSDPDPEKPFFTREWGDWEDPGRVGRESGEGALVRQVETRQRYLNGSGYWDWGGLDANPRIGGYFLWVFEDYGTNSPYQKSGAVDIDRYPKYCYYWLKGMQSPENPNHGGPMVFIASSYSAESSREVTVFSNTDHVKLYQNGTLVGEKSRSQNAGTAKNIAAKGGSPSYSFSLDSFVAGELRAEGCIDGKPAATQIVKTPGAPHHIQIEIDDAGVRSALRDLLAYYLGNVSPVAVKAAAALADEVQPGTVESLIGKLSAKRGSPLPAVAADTLRRYARARTRIQPVADGSDLIPVYIKVVDVDGTVIPTSTAEIELAVTGKGSLVGHDIPRLAVQTQKARAGIGYALLAVDTEPGDITLTATADGLESGSWTVATSRYSGRYMPDGRHPEWKDISTLESQGAQNIALNMPATASSFQEGNIPGNAVDDDSDSKWVASGDIPAWWQVDLGQPSDISEFQIVWESDQATYRYAVLTSDDATNWTKVVDEESNTTTGGTADHRVSVKARYVRVNVLSGGGWWPSMREFRVVPPGGTGGGQPADPGPKVPRGQIGEVSASSHASGFEPAKAFDDDITFGTGWVAESAALPQTLTAQLPAAHDLVGALIHWGKDSSWYTYDLQVSGDGNAWTTVLPGLTRGGQYTLPETFTAPGARYVRINITDVVGGGAQSVAGIAEVTLYGSPS
ncbi:discoidin domain-containing protein [Streptomyces sp. NBC_01500]|uniref:discoidin domain-containing protein n=1 Tax=Streptomyces sp. NBC_01500 TaxID=2903886 RepID=UPI0022599A06|nr:discoidin domain-containing protein [Streptomyces sp. NBC_01500]MCX4552317.1 discoidin domain-containing protein [Streptomyces sp. NBC_01500]